MEAATFEDRITGSNSNGGQRICQGTNVVYCDVIPDDAPQDGVMGVKIVPGQFGIFLEHLWYERRHGPYPVVTASTPEAAKLGAKSLFKRQISEWQIVVE